MTRIDLRSDTVTLPSAGMRKAMVAAPVGDDQYGEDPSVNRLQERIADLLGKEAALFVPSGTMANQIGLKILTRPGDEVILGDEAHIVWHEAGAGAANSGVQFSVVGRGRLFPDAAAAGSCFRKTMPSRSVMRRASSAWRAISTERGSSTPPRRQGEVWPSWRHPSILSPLRCRKVLAARSAA